MNIFEHLAKLADELDKKGLYSEAGEIDEFIKNAVDNIDEEAPLREFDKYKQQAVTNLIDEALQTPEPGWTEAQTPHRYLMRELNEMRGKVDLETALNKIKQYTGEKTLPSLSQLYKKYSDGLQQAYSNMNAQRQQAQQQLGGQQQEKGTAGETTKKQENVLRWQNKLNKFIDTQLKGENTKWFLGNMKEYGVSKLTPDKKWGPKTNAAYKLWRDVTSGKIKPNQPAQKPEDQQKQPTQQAPAQKTQREVATETAKKQKSDAGRWIPWLATRYVRNSGGNYEDVKNKIRRRIDTVVESGVSLKDAVDIVRKELNV